MPVLDGPPPLPQTLTLGDLVNKVQRYLTPAQRAMAVVVGSPYTAGSDTINLSGVAVSAIAVGAVLSIDLELFYVLGWIPASGTSGTAQVIPGYLGTEMEDHDGSTQVFIDQQFTAFDIAMAINDDLYDLSSPDNGIYAITSTTITYNPAYMGYDLGALPNNFIDILQINYRIPTPTQNYPAIAQNKWKIVRNITGDNSQFPSGNGLIIYESAYPGLPMFVVYAAPLSPLTHLSDPVVSTTGMPPTCVDIPPLGAACRLVEGREVKRNFMENQPDARKAQEVPPAAVMNSMRGLAARRQMRIDAEADRITRQYPRIRSY